MDDPDPFVIALRRIKGRPSGSGRGTGLGVSYGGDCFTAPETSLCGHPHRRRAGRLTNGHTGPAEAH